MAGAPSFGKISTFICRMAMIDVSATASTATRIVTGRRMAVSTNHMRCLPEPLVVQSRFDLLDERREITVRLRRGEQRTPDAEPRNRVIGFGLREQPLRFGHLDDAGESILIPSAGLTFAGRGGFTFSR